MQKSTKENQFIKKPVYLGGLKAMRDFIKKELRYPQAALDANAEGTVYIRYEIGHKGNVLKSKVLSGVGHGCDEEAKRLVGLLKFQVPKNPRKLKIKFHKKLKIHFRLPKSAEAPVPKDPLFPQKATQKISYTITTTTKATPAPKSNQGGYSYTITY